MIHGIGCHTGSSARCTDENQVPLEVMTAPVRAHVGARRERGTTGCCRAALSGRPRCEVVCTNSTATSAHSRVLIDVQTVVLVLYI